MRKTLLILLWLACAPAILPAQTDYSISGRSAAMGNAGVALNDIWSVYQNQAGLAAFEGFSGGVFYENRFLVKELSGVGFALAQKVGGGVLGLSYRQRGDKNLAQSQFGLAYARSLSSKLNVGVSLDAFSIRAGSNYGRRTVLLAQFGFQYQVAERFVLAGHVFNPWAAKLADFRDERLASVLKVGGRFDLAEGLIISGEVSKNVLYNPQFRLGIEYEIFEKLWLRGGVDASPAQFTFGLGYRWQQWQLDVGTGYNSVLGYTPQISLAYRPAAE